ncbi:TonB-dependent receptor [Antarcticibacterium flavum]|uniref:TonB-dependent receptor n=1 Tax=Antarcticibacterium flavum TaxID=2058175 RepID=A0A5B7X0R9_9FLAO|nr:MULTISPECIES: TonB-dependent receptor [Antarcticibacterium]MCM4159009.1 TonB-dependent receptor [Antarcticibacterium sp. W02-3]QCY68258.1 TonB-dependent receptor [Antarcticibacterium flavum]
MINKFLPISFLLILFFTLPLNSFAQSSEYTISGKVIDDDMGVPLEYATISITKPNDPEYLDGGVTDLEGNFALKVGPGTYNITIEYISFEPKRFNNRQVNADLNLGTIELGISQDSLDEVVVVAETTEVEVRLDKKIYNIGKDLTTAGGTVADALNNVPSVAVDVEGGISLRGNDNVRILINGKPSAMAGFGSTDVLAQLPAEAIERVEVITSPSARYDAEGTAGILNIILRKEKTLGFNGSLTANAGYPDNAGISANVNLRTDKFNIFNTTGFRYFDAPGNNWSDTRYRPRRNSEGELVDPEFDRIYERRIVNRLNRNFNTNFGVEYYLNDQSSLTASIFYRYGEDEDITTNNSDRYRSGSLVEQTLRRELETEKDNRYQFSVNYINRFNDKGHQLTADIQIGKGNEVGTGFITENQTFSRENIERNFIEETIAQTEDETEYLIQADYVLPIGENSQFEAGFRGEFENTVTDYELLFDGEVNERLTNVFDYTENVNALYSQYGTKFGDFSFLLGLRLENTQLKGNIDSRLTDEELREEFGFTIDTDFDNNYLGLFPTVNLIYEIGDQENITLGYNRRINRPRGWFINPFPSRSSRTNVFQGNPNLRPAFANAWDLGYLKRWGKLTFTSSVYYQLETDAFQRIEEFTGAVTPGDEIPITRTIPVNLATNERIGGELGFLYNPASWLRLNGSFNFFQFNTEGEFEGQDYSVQNTSWFGRFSSKVSLPASIEWQTNAFYRGPSDDVQGRQEGILSIDLALSKDIFNDNATISFNVRDLLNSRKRRSFTSTEFFDRDSEFQWRERSFNLSLVYRFNQQKREQDRRNRQQDSGDMDGDFEG